MLYRLFQQNGYQVNLINHNGFLGEEHCNLLSQPQYDETISDYLYENSIFCQIPELKWIIEREILHRGEHGPMESLQNVSQSLKTAGCRRRRASTLTVSYFVSPHAPFLFDESGKRTSPDAYYDWRIPELYSAKLEYTNQVILEAVDQIQRHDPDGWLSFCRRIMEPERQDSWSMSLAVHGLNTGRGNSLYAERFMLRLCAGGELVFGGETCINATRKVFSSCIWI